jgi:hypothetical protein
MVADQASTAVDAEFERIAGRAVGEPLFGVMQAELIRGMSKRLSDGPPMSEFDRATYLDQLRILHIDVGEASV